jgi:cytochrome o ubiquinol oxidase subunit IV
MMAQVDDASDRTGRSQRERRDLLSYAWGIGLALVLTLVPFALVRGAGIARLPLLMVIGAFALVQMIVHFRFFLHISFRQKREDLQLILFSTLVLIILVGGTVWIMASRALRMAMPMQP